MGSHAPLIDLMRLERLALKQRRRVLKLRERLQDEEDLLSSVIQASVLARAAVEQPEPVAARAPEAPRAAATAGPLDYSEPNDGQSSPPLAGANGAALAQLAEHRPHGTEVAGSTPAGGLAPRGNDSGGSGAAPAPADEAQSPEPSGSSLRHAHAKPVAGFHRGGSAWGKQAKDETGKRYGKLVVIERAPNDGRLARWRCGCDCGGQIVAAGAYLRQGKITSCPACHVDGRKHQTCSICGDRAHRAPWCPQRPKDEPADVAEGFKRCCQCRAVKPVADFYAHTASGGYQARCKLCDNKARVQRTGGVAGGQVGRPPKRNDCPTCKSMSSRVEGVRCVDCGLEAERPPRATDFTGGDSALARAIG